MTKFSPTNNLVQNINFRNVPFCFFVGIQFLGFLANLYSFDRNGNKEDKRQESSLNEEINFLINESSEESQIDSGMVTHTRKKRKAPLIREFAKRVKSITRLWIPKGRKNHALSKKHLNWKVIARLGISRGRQNCFW